MDVFEAMGSARAMRYFRPDPVPDELVEQLLWAATRASSANNSQPWDFVVVRDAEQRARIGACFGPHHDVDDAQLPSDPIERRTVRGAMHLFSTFADVPVLIFVCGEDRYPPNAPDERYLWSAVHAAGQNLIVAARALGLGAAFTTAHLVDEPAIRDILGLPDDRVLGLTIPVGWPDAPTGPVTRLPVADVVHHDRW